MPKSRRTLLSRLIRRDGGVCFYCGCKVRRFMPSKDRPPSNGATADRIVPGSLGGGYNIENTVLACFACNNSRANQPAHLFIQIRQEGRP